MGLSVSILVSAWKEILNHRFFELTHNINFSSKDKVLIFRTQSFKKSANSAETMSLSREPSFKINKNNKPNSLKGHKPERVILESNLSFKNLVQDHQKEKDEEKVVDLPDPVIMFSPKPVCELNAAAVKLQKVYKSYRTRRNLADCAVVVEELWWKALDFAALKRSSISFFNIEKPETAVSRWARARTRAAKVGKGLSKDEKAQKLALQHWLEAIDPRHRYGHNLHLYYDIWFESESSQPFFYWLDVGDGLKINLEKCLRAVLQRQCIKYLGPKEREAYEVVVENGKLVYRQSGMLVETVEGSKLIFVLSTARSLYVGQKKKGLFQHSSFLAGAATTAAGRLVAHQGIIEAIWPYSGHYHPTEENFKEFISFLEENHVDLSNVEMRAFNEEASFMNNDEDIKPEQVVDVAKSIPSDDTTKMDAVESTELTAITTIDQKPNVDNSKVEAPIFDLSKRLSRKWSTGAGPRIGCVRDYPTELQTKALERVNLSPRVASGTIYGPIPSPRPSPKVRLSPRFAYMGLPSPRNPISVGN